MRNCLLAMLVASLAFGAFAEGWRIRATQLDLARQMETVAFVKRYLSFAKASGYNTVQLYLEGRVRTRSFSARPETETYSPEQMKEIVAEAGRLELDLVPVVSVLGHAENFVNCPELDSLCEETRAGHSRFPDRPLKQTFCHSVPETRVFLERYLSDLIEIFPGQNFHVGLDESFNTGFCPECADLMRAEKVGLGGIYMDVIRWAHGFLAKRGRRMWMWGDFFEFFPERAGELPKDVVICDWEYSADISPNRGHYGTFGDRYRKDWVRTFGARGMDVLVCPSSRKRPMTRYGDYAENAGASGGIFVQWEMSTVFHGKRLISSRATGLRWSRGLDALDYDESVAEAVRQICPSLSGPERQAVQELVTEGTGCELALETLKARQDEDVSADPFSEQAILDDLMTESRVASVCAQANELESAVSGLYRRPAAILKAKAKARVLRKEAEGLKMRRLKQEAAWRPDCRPNELAKPIEDVVARLDTVLSAAESPAPDDEWQLEMSFVLPDYHGIPFWRVYGLFDSRYRELARGKWKPGPDEWCYFERTFPFRSEKAPRALRIVYTGYNDGGLAFVSVANRGKGRFVPGRITACQGRVRDVDNLLEDTVDAAFFGNPNCRAQILDPALADEVSWVDVDLKADR